MASTTFSGPVTSTNGFIGSVTGAITGNVTGTLTGNVDATAGYIQLRTAAATEIADIADAINTSGKAAGTIAFDTTNSKIKVATGADADSTWVDADGTNAVTPS